MFVTSQAEAREFEATQNGQTIKVKAVDVTLSDGINTIVASAYDKKAQQLIDHPLKAGTFLNADLTFSVRKTKNEKGEWSVQQVRLNNYGVIAEG